MDIRQLRYFLGIIDCGSLSRAAATLRVAQPALSLHLKRLEEELGCALVLRTARGVVPTDSGRRLAERAAAVVAALESLRDDVRGIEAAPSGPAVIGIPTSLGSVLTVPLALAVRRHHPGVRLRVVEGLSGHMLEWVRSGAVDMALIFGAERMEGLETVAVAREGLTLVAPQHDPLMGDGAAIPFAAVLDLPLILPGRPHGVREEVERAAVLLDRTPQVVMEIDALDQIKALVAEGVGYTVLSERVARGGASAPRLAHRPIGEPAIERTILMAHAAGRPLPAAARAVRALALDLLGGMTHEGRWTA